MCSWNSRFRPNFTLNHFSSPGWVESECSQSLWGLAGASARPHPSPAGGSAEYYIHPLSPAACLWSTPRPTSKIDTHDKKKRQGKLCDLSSCRSEAAVWGQASFYFAFGVMMEQIFSTVSLLKWKQTVSFHYCIIREEVWTTHGGKKCGSLWSYKLIERIRLAKQGQVKWIQSESKIL